MLTLCLFLFKLLTYVLRLTFEFGPFIFLIFTAVFFYKEDASESIFWDLWNYVYYNVISVFEMCDDKWITANISGLVSDLNNYVYGQPFLLSLIVPAIQFHLDPKYKSRKALVFSFNGPPGTGKNYVVDFISKNIYLKGAKSGFVKFYRGSIDYSPTLDLESYKRKVQANIIEQIIRCPRSLFIFDEIEKLPSGALDALKPFLDYNHHVNHLDFRRSVFIFLSNTGSKQIYKTCLELIRDKKDREEFGMIDFEENLRNVSYKDDGVFQHSSLILHDLIDHYVPFLPLERKHILNCIKDEASRQGISVTPELTREVMGNLVFEPEPEGIFSPSGCKNLASKISSASPKTFWAWEGF